MKSFKKFGNKRIAAGLLSAAMVLSMVPMSPARAESQDSGTLYKYLQAGEEDLGNNIALKATAGASYTNVWGISPDAMNDGKLATSDPYSSWNSWGTDDSSYPVTTSLTWDTEQVITGMRVIWWADNATINANANVTFPKSAALYYVDSEGNEHQITGMTNEKGMPTDEVGVEVDSSSNNGINGNNQYWNYVEFSEPITTSQLRMKIQRNGTGTNGVGISEWEAFGYQTIGTGTNVAGEASVTTSYTNTTLPDNAETAINDGTLADGNWTTWNTWSESGDVEYPVTVDLDWGNATYDISSVRVMWWSDNGGVQFPASCQLQWYNERSKEWVDVTQLVDETGADTSSVGVKFGAADQAGEDASQFANGANRYWNGVAMNESVQTSKLRLVIDRNGSGQTGVGIGEVEVYGTKLAQTDGDNVALQATASADAQNTPVTNVNNGQLATNAGTSWNTWNSSTYPTTVTLTWDAPYVLNSMRVMYWADNGNLTASGNVTFPKSCEVEYFNHESGQWEKITNMTNESGQVVSSVGVKYGSAEAASDQPGSYLNGNNRYWNVVSFQEPVKTTQIRLKIDRNGSGANGVGIGEWEVYGEEMTAEWNELVSTQITGKDRILKGETGTFTAESLPVGLDGMSYQWELTEGSQYMEIVGATDEAQVQLAALDSGYGTLKVTVSRQQDGQTVTRTATLEVKVDGIESLDEYVTATEAGRAPILPKTVVANGIAFDDPTPDLYGPTGYNFAEEFNASLVPVTWEEVDPALYAEDKVGTTFEVKGTVVSGDEELEAVARVTVNEPVVTPVANSTVTFENVQLTDNFWNPKQKVNAVNSLNKAIYQIEQASGGEPNFVNAIAKLNGEPYDEFQGYVFQDSDIYKSIEAISYTLSVIHDDTDPEMVAQREKLEEKLAYWISLIEQVQYADGYINTHFTLRSTGHAGGSSAGTHRWHDFSNHEMYNAGHFLEGVVAYTRYREGIGDPDYSLYIVGRRFADEIVDLFGPDGSRHEVPGHEEIELALVKFAKLVEEYEGEGTGDKYVQTAKTLIDRRGTNMSERESGYNGGEYSQDNDSIMTITEAVGHAVRACYFYTGVTDVATLLPEDDPDRAAYLNTMDAIWDSVANTKTYITGGIGVRSHGEDFGDPYELPNDDSYCEICATIALANWNQRMNLIHEDAKYADVVEKNLYNAILVGTNLTGDKFYYSTYLEAKNGDPRSDWFACACCPPNLMRTIAKLSEYMYTIHGDKLFVNMYIGSEGNLNIDGTNVNLTQETEYPWDGAVKLTVTPDEAKEFTMNIRIPGWTQEQANKEVSIYVNGEKVTAEAEKGYVAITRTWEKGDIVRIDMPMEVRMTEADPNVEANQGRIAIQRGPIVYSIEMAGNAQLNSDIANFSPLNFVIPRDAQLTATYNEDLLNGVVEITGDVKYNDNGNLIDAKLQAIPYYAWNNRGNDGVEGQNNCSQMLIWTNTTGASVKIGGASEVAVDDSFTLNAVAAGLDNPTYTWTVKDGDAVEIAEGADTATVTLNALKEGTAVVSVTATSGEDSVSAAWTVTVTKGGEPAPGDVDKTLLEKTIAYAEGLDTTGVTDSAVAAFQTALDEAKAVMADENATQAEVNNAWDNLLEGIWGLGLTQGDKTLLEQLITKADDMVANADQYMADHWQELVDALAKAKDVYADGDAMEEDVQPAAQALLNAILAQRFKADKSILEDLIGKAESMDLSGYTAESVATFRTALANAQAVMADATLSEDDQATVDAAVAALNEAMNGLTAEGTPEPSDEPETTDKPEASQNPEATDKPQATEKPENVPQTGDSAQLMGYVAALAAAVMVLGAVTVVRRRRNG